MVTRLNPYLSFRDNAREAMEFYKNVFGGELTLSTFAENGMADDPAEKDKIMHGQLDSASGFVLMGADTPNSMHFDETSNISVSLSGDENDELTGYWERLSEGATIVEPLTVAPWGDSFGMLNDRYGVSWMVNIAGKQE